MFWKPIFLKVDGKGIRVRVLVFVWVCERKRESGREKVYVIKKVNIIYSFYGHSCYCELTSNVTSAQMNKPLRHKSLIWSKVIWSHCMLQLTQYQLPSYCKTRVNCYLCYLNHQSFKSEWTNYSIPTCP